MKKEIEKTVKELIAKNLPQATAETLTGLLAERESALERVIDLEKIIDSKNKDYERISKEVIELHDLKLKSEKIEIAKIKFEEEKRNFCVEKAEFKLVEAEKRAHMAERLVETVFKNRQMTVNSFTNGMKPVMKDGYVNQEPFSSQTTIQPQED